MNKIEPQVLIVLIIVSTIIYIVVMYYILRWIFDIKRQLWNQQQQIILLVRIAEKLGVDINDDQIDRIKRKNAQ